MFNTRLVVVSVASVCLCLSPQSSRANDDGKKVLLAAAAIAGVAALAHHNKNHEDGNHYNDANAEAEYERGYNDGLYAADYNNHNRTDAYSNGFDAGNHDRNVRVSHQQNNRWSDDRHDSPDTARRACIGEASSRWQIDPRDIVATSSRSTGNNEYEVTVSAGYHRSNCGATGDGRFHWIEDLDSNNSWGHNAPHGRDDHPYTTSEYDATTELPCSLGSPSHNRRCAAGINRGDSGSASIYLRSPDGRERILNFANGDVTTPNGGRLTWGQSDGEWYVGIDDREFYIVPEAAIYGG
jgi:hypothetical protein